MNIGVPIKRFVAVPLKHPVDAPEPQVPAPPQRETAPPAEPAKVPEKV